MNRKKKERVTMRKIEITYAVMMIEPAVNPQTRGVKGSITFMKLTFSFGSGHAANHRYRKR